MLFSSLVFLFYFLPIVSILYFCLQFSRPAQNGLLFFASIFFYAWGEPRFVLILLASILFNYLMGLLVDKFREQKNVTKKLMFLTVLVNVGILFIFKYLNFVVWNINGIFGLGMLRIPAISLPLGISFFTFQAMSYVIDVYREDSKAEKNLLYLGLYITFFPQLIAGPIVRFHTIAEQIRGRKTTKNGFAAGCSRFALGLVRKVLLANNLAIVADHIFRMSDNSGAYAVPVLLAWLGAAAYTLQIFYDFSAYSDMAIGLGLMFGFKFEENFNYPYVSKSVGEFWRRWHISLSAWFREYVYIPLGGSRVSNQDKMVRNLFVVWMLTGIWHGAEWTFVLWGFCNFVFILLERLIDFEERSIPDILRHIYLLFVVTIGWVLFRADNLDMAFVYLRNIFGFGGNGFFSDTAWMFLKEYGVFFIAGILFSMPIVKEMEELIVKQKIPIIGKICNILYPIVLLTLFIVSVTYLVKGSYNPFIYFNF